MEGLLTWTAERVAKFPRDHKFTVGDRLLETCLDVMAALTDAAFRRDKHEVLAAASRGLVRARILARLARVLLCLSEAQHLHFVRESDEVGRMLGGWIRSGATEASRFRSAAESQSRILSNPQTIPWSGVNAMVMSLATSSRFFPVSAAAGRSKST